MSVQRRVYDQDFKGNAVRLSEEPGQTVKDVASHLSIAVDLLYRQRREYRSKENGAFPGREKEALTDQERRIRELEKKHQRCRNGERYSKKSHGHFHQSTEMRFQFIEECLAVRS